jgi:hypothetical protein
LPSFRSVVFGLLRVHGCLVSVSACLRLVDSVLLACFANYYHLTSKSNLVCLSLSLLCRVRLALPWPPSILPRASNNARTNIARAWIPSSCACAMRKVLSSESHCTHSISFHISPFLSRNESSRLVLLFVHSLVCLLALPCAIDTQTHYTLRIPGCSCSDCQCDTRFVTT